MNHNPNQGTKCFSLASVIENSNQITKPTSDFNKSVSIDVDQVQSTSKKVVFFDNSQIDFSALSSQAVFKKKQKEEKKNILNINSLPPNSNQNTAQLSLEQSSKDLDDEISALSKQSTPTAPKLMLQKSSMKRNPNFTFDIGLQMLKMIGNLRQVCADNFDINAAVDQDSPDVSLIGSRGLNFKSKTSILSDSPVKRKVQK